MENAKIWKEISIWADHVTDALGMPIDPEIKEVVIGLNANGISTYASCGGHINDDRREFPWIGCKAPDEPDYRYLNEPEIVDSIIKKYKIDPPQKNMIFGNGLAIDEYYRRTRNELDDPKYVEWNKGNYPLQVKVYKLLEEFNAQPSHTKGIRYVYGGIYPGCLIEIPDDQEKHWKKSLPDKELISKILEAREEMIIFASFLKDKFERQS